MTSVKIKIKMVINVMLIVLSITSVIFSLEIASSANELWHISANVNTTRELVANSPEGEKAVSEAFLKAKKQRNDLINSGNAIERYITNANDSTQVLLGLGSAIVVIVSSIATVMFLIIFTNNIKVIKKQKQKRKK
ncbi:MAG: hypothetical protein RSA08_00090 [Clostridia bacterium]